MTPRALIVGALGIIINYAANHEIEAAATENRHQREVFHECPSFGRNAGSV